MTIFPGVVSLDDSNIKVTVGLDDNTITLVAGEVEIGEWSSSECQIKENGKGSWVIEAEEERLPFLPDDPSGFALWLNGDVSSPQIQPSPAGGSDPAIEGPPPRPLTVTAFYALAALTTALGVWALITLIT